MGALKLEVIGETQLAGREAIRLRGARRSAQQLAELDFELRLAGDECELDVDAERGVLLRMLACHEGLGSSLEEGRRPSARWQVNTRSPSARSALTGSPFDAWGTTPWF